MGTKKGQRRKTARRAYEREASPAVKKASRSELREFVDSWRDKVNIPPRWVQKNLKWARWRLK